MFIWNHVTGGYDLHSNLLVNFENRAMDLNESIQSFIDEIKIQGLWNDVTVVAVTEFARTLTENTGSGRYVEMICIFFTFDSPPLILLLCLLSYHK